jgi:hypothetical protein
MTPQELRDAVLMEVGVLAAGESAAPEDAAVVTAKYALLHDTLTQRDMTSWDASDDIPDDVAQSVVLMVAHLCASPFGVPPQRAAELLQLGALDLPQPSLAERQIRRAMAEKYVSTPAKSEYF